MNARMNSRPTRSCLTAFLSVAALIAARSLLEAAEVQGMVFPDKDWEQAEPQSQGVDAKKLQAAVAYLKANAPRDGVSELVIIRHGQLIHVGPEIDKVHGIWSCTKSFTSTVLGLLHEDGKCTPDTLAKDHVSEMSATYPEVTLRHFTTMTSGYRAVGDETRGGYTHGPSQTPFQPNPQPLFSPGSAYAYWDSAMNQFAHVLTRIAGEPIEELFRRRIADPIGMNPDKWDWGDFGQVNGLTVNGGSGNNGKHMQISAREMARMGHLLLNRGNWNGRQLINTRWIEQATRVQVPAALPLGHTESGIAGPGMYGFNFWVNGVKPDGTRKWPGIPACTFAASGHNNNDMFVIPDWNMVIVRLGLDEGGEGGFEITDGTHAAFLRRVGDAILDEDATAASTDQSYFPPPDDQGGWRRLERDEDIRSVVDMDRAKLDEAFQFVQESTKNGGLLVLRKGWLVHEQYFGRGHREATPNLASCGKSFTSISVGILMSERPDLFPEGLEQKVLTPKYFPPEAFPLDDPRKKQIKLGQLLSMSAGIRGNNPVYVHGKPSSIDPIGPDGWQGLVDAITLGKQDGRSRGRPVTTKTLWCEPGGGYSYATASIHLASVMLRHVTGMELQEFIDERLARRLGWGRWGFGYKNAKAVTHTPGGGGIALRATDMLRFGYLLLNEGRWNGHQLVPAEFVRQCGRTSQYNPHFPYSLQFTVNTDGDIPELPRDAFWKSGSGGHNIYVVPSLDLVVWKLGGRDSQYEPSNTGLAWHPDVPKEDRSRDVWKQTAETQTATHQTLQMVVEAINK